MSTTTQNMKIAPEARAAFLELIRPTAAWVYVEYNKTYENGAELLTKKLRCDKCGFERAKRLGPSNFCEVCGARMKKPQEGDIKT